MDEDTQIGAALAAAMQAGRIIRVMRGDLEPDAWAAGYVLATSPELVLMHRLSDSISLDGYEILRIGDIDEMEDVSPRLDFYARALALKGERPRPPDGIDIGTWSRAVETIAAAFPLLVIGQEEDAPDEVMVGRVTSVLPSGFRIDAVTPEAEIEVDPTLYPFARVTRLEFGGAYEQTLALVAGLLPAWPR